jgi:N-acetylneuraminic acid mutarotase
MADGSFGPAGLVAELNSPTNEADSSIRHDGLELIFHSNRTGSIGTANDLWVATRASTIDAWSTAVSLGTAINTDSAEQNPFLSSDGTVLFFASDRAGGSGGLDLYMSTRTFPAPRWTTTGNLNTGRDSHTATLLLNGKVLVAGGNDSNGTLKSSELYDPATEIWTSTGNLNISRAFHTATLLSDGKVLVAGGFTCAPPPQVCSHLNSAELYDPNNGTWSNVGNLNTARDSHTATLMSNGKVLVVGGILDGSGATTNRAELYDPDSRTWSYTGNLKVDRGAHTATILPDSKILVAGGVVYTCGPLTCDNIPTSSAELYDPTTATWSLTGNLNEARVFGTATALTNGKVLVAGGVVYFSTGLATNRTELYDPATGIWSFTGSLNTGRGYHTGTLLPGGRVLIFGGFNLVNGLPNIENTAELYNPATGVWSNTVSLNIGRRFHAATLLPTGKVLATGGNGYNAPNSAELYDAGGNEIDDAQFFVHQHYLDFLNREPDPGGLAYWTSRIMECGSDARCIHERRVGVSAAFFIEQEFQDTGYYVYRFYKASFGRRPDFAEFTADRKVVAGANIEASKQAFADEWVQRLVFLAAYPNAMSNSEFVNKLFDMAGLTGSIYDPQRQTEIAAMNAGRSRALVLRDVIETPDFKNVPNPNDPRYPELKQVSQYNPAFVLMQYFGYLRRNVDQDGYDFWLDILNNREPNNYVSMVCAFVTSREYQRRFGSTAMRTNADCQ